MIYEERKVVVKRGAADEYVGLFSEQLVPSIEAHGGEVLRLVSGLIGASTADMMAITRYPDIDKWQKAQDALDQERLALLESEEVRLMKSIASRPKQIIPHEDSRAFYGYRRFWIDPKDLKDFVNYSEEGIWPRIEAQGARILGLWTLVASTVPQEIILMTGYHGPAHWEQTRSTQPPPSTFDEQAVESSRRMYAGRYELPLRTWVQLMRAIEL